CCVTASSCHCPAGQSQQGTRSQGAAPPRGPVRGYWARHACPAALAQVAICSPVPLTVESPGSARHSPDCGLTRLTPPPPGTSCHCCAPVPLQDHRSTGVPLTVPLCWTSRHFPWTRTVPSGPVVHCWPLVPSQDDMSILVPFAV